MKFNTVSQAMSQIDKAKNITVDNSKKLVLLNNGEGEKSGLKILSAVDCLVNYHGYRLAFIRKA